MYRALIAGTGLLASINVVAVLRSASRVNSRSDPAIALPRSRCVRRSKYSGRRNPH
jgi:hypothetical protein